MTLQTEVQVTTGLLLRSTLLAAALDAALATLLAWRIRPAHFFALRRPLIILTGLFWGGLWFMVLSTWWEPVYRYLFTDRMRGWLPIAQALGAAAVSALALWAARRVHTHPAPVYLLVGGLYGALTHLWAVNRGIVSKPPMLRSAAPAAAVAFAFFEFIFYWCMLVIAACVVHRLSAVARLHRVKQTEDRNG